MILTEVGPGDLTIQQVAEYLRLDRTTVGKYIKSGELVAKKVPGKGRDGSKRIPQAELDRFIAEREIPAKTPPVRTS